jgi:ABC-2 type transport system permease protein
MPQLGITGSGGPTFQTLERKLRENTTVEPTNLKSGRVPEQADLLFVVAPENLDTNQLFAVDQFLMKGGTIIIATAPFQTSFESGLRASNSPSGRKDWLAHNGMNIQDAMVLDPQNSPFPVPMDRDVGGSSVRWITS